MQAFLRLLRGLFRLPRLSKDGHDRAARRDRDEYKTIQSSSRKHSVLANDSSVELDGNYLLIRFRCTNCEAQGVIKAVMVNATHFGLVGRCENCQHRDTVWYAMHQIDSSTKGDLVELPRIN
jgi:hypothetical protein